MNHPHGGRVHGEINITKGLLELVARIDRSHRASEIGGEVRAVAQIDARIAEAARLGFQRALVPEESAKALAGRKGLDIVPVSNIIEALDGAREDGR